VSPSGRTELRDGADGAPPPSLSVVVPAYNEGASIEAVLRRFERTVATPHETLVVYDFEADDTLPVVRELQPVLPAVRLVRNDLGRGVLAALRKGFETARAPLVLVTMADGSDDPSCVDSMVRLAEEGASVVVASRYAPGGHQLGGPRLKAASSRLAGWLLHHLGGLPVTDPTNNFKLYRTDYLAAVTIESQRGFELALELTVKAHARRLVLAEVPTTWTARSVGESRFDARRLLPGYLHWFLFGLRTRWSPAPQSEAPAAR
jgi:dolichol-phosphate mannosyltransferase